MSLTLQETSQPLRSFSAHSGLGAGDGCVTVTHLPSTRHSLCRQYLSYKESSATNCTGGARNGALTRVSSPNGAQGGSCQCEAPACLGVLFQPRAVPSSAERTGFHPRGSKTAPLELRLEGVPFSDMRFLFHWRWA